MLRIYQLKTSVIPFAKNIVLVYNTVIIKRNLFMCIYYYELN